MTGLLAAALLLLVALHRAASEPDAPRGPASAAPSGPFASRQACLSGLRAGPREPGPPRVGSWNIRWFPDGSARGPHPERATDLEWLACAIASLGVQVLAVQEVVQHPRGRRALLDLLDLLDTHTGGRWDHALDDCPGSGRQHVGLLFDTARVRVERPRAIALLNPGSSACDHNLRPGFGAYLRFAGGPDLHLVTVHLDSGRSKRDYDNRVTSNARLTAAVQGLGEVARDEDVIVLGDFNTMGCGSCDPKVEPDAERAALGRAAERAGLSLLAAQPSCTHYYRSRPGILDHVLVSRGMRELARPVHPVAAGPCSRLGCQRPPRGEPQPALDRLSDHCPLVLELTARDDD